MGKLKKIEGINYDVNDRWEKGINHHPKSVETYKRIAELDIAVANDSFCFKSGGDGDNGESLMYLMDIVFEEKDALAEIAKGIKAEHSTITRKWFSEKFHEITENLFNGETVKDIEY